MNAADYGNKLTEYTNQLYEKLSATMPTVQYNPTSTAQLRDNLEAAYRAGYDQSVDARREATRRNNAAIDADAAARGMGASTWVTDAKMRQADSEAADLASLAAQRDSAIAQQLASALSSQEANRLAVEQFNASQKANALSQALAGAQNMIALDQQKSRGSGGKTVKNPEDDLRRQYQEYLEKNQREQEAWERIHANPPTQEEVRAEMDKARAYYRDWLSKQRSSGGGIKVFNTANSLR